MIIRRAKLSDLPRIMTIEFLAFDHPETDEVMARTIEHGNCYVTEERGSVTAHAAWGDINDFVEDLSYPACDLWSIAVHPEHQRRGIGRAILHYLMAHYDYITTIVSERNVVGSTFLSSCGIRAVAVLDNYFHDHKLDAYAFKWHSGANPNGPTEENQEHLRTIARQ